MVKLNLGCGQFSKNGYVNVDIKQPADIIHDLNEFPYPFENNQFDLIEADHILEHLSNTLKTLKELHRILKSNGELIIKVPHFSRGFTNPDHKAGFDISFPFWFNPEFQPWYTGIDFKLKKMRLRWFAQFYLKKQLFPIAYYPFRIIGWLIDYMANLSPAFCSRIWCYWVGGFDEIEFIFIKEK